MAPKKFDIALSSLMAAIIVVQTSKQGAAGLILEKGVLDHGGTDPFSTLPLVVPGDHFIVEVEGKAKIGRLTIVGWAGPDCFMLAALDSAAVESIHADGANLNRRVLQGRVARLTGTLTNFEESYPWKTACQKSWYICTVTVREGRISPPKERRAHARRRSMAVPFSSEVRS